MNDNYSTGISHPKTLVRRRGPEIARRKAETIEILRTAETTQVAPVKIARVGSHDVILLWTHYDAVV